MLTVAIPKRNKLQNIIVLTPKDGYLARRGFRPGEISSVLEEMEISFHKNYGNK